MATYIWRCSHMGWDSSHPCSRAVHTRMWGLSPPERGDSDQIREVIVPTGWYVLCPRGAVPTGVAICGFRGCVHFWLGVAHSKVLGLFPLRRCWLCRKRGCGLFPPSGWCLCRSGCLRSANPELRALATGVIFLCPQGMWDLFPPGLGGCDQLFVWLLCLPRFGPSPTVVSGL